MYKLLLSLKALSLIKGIIAALLTFFLPIFPAMIAVGVLISIDTITGMIAAKKRGEKITSKKLGGAITKSFVYQLLVISAHLCEVFLFPIIPFLKISLAFLAMTEFTSLNENIQVITGKNLIKYIKQAMDSKLRGLIAEDKSKDIDKTI